MSFPAGVPVKEELEIGPTVLQARSVFGIDTKVEWDEEFDTSEPTSCSIKTEIDVDDESEPAGSELLTTACAPPDIPSVKNRVSTAQMNDLLDYLGNHSGLVKGVGLGLRSKETQDRLWKALALKLNAHAGASKTGQRWKKYWADLKHKVKRRVAARKREASSTGGGSPESQGARGLSDFDLKVLAIIGKGAVYGNPEHRVPAFPSPSARPTSASLPSTRPVSTSLPSTSTQRTTQSVAGTEFEIGSQHTSDGSSQVTSAPSSTALGDSPVSRRRPRARRVVMSSETDTSWVIDLERRRVEAEGKLADAALIIAEAARVMANAAQIQAEAAQKQADTARMQMEAILSQKK